MYEQAIRPGEEGLAIGISAVFYVAFFCVPALLFCRACAPTWFDRFDELHPGFKIQALLVFIGSIVAWVYLPWWLRLVVPLTLVGYFIVLRMCQPAANYEFEEMWYMPLLGTLPFLGLACIIVLWLEIFIG